MTFLIRFRFSGAALLGVFIVERMKLEDFGICKEGGLSDPTVFDFLFRVWWVAIE